MTENLQLYLEEGNVFKELDFLSDRGGETKWQNSYVRYAVARLPTLAMRREA